MPVGCELRAALQADTAGTPQSPVATKKVSRLWEQDAAGSNPVSPMRSETCAQLVFKPSREGRFFVGQACLCNRTTKGLYCRSGREPRTPSPLALLEAEIAYGV